MWTNLKVLHARCSATGKPVKDEFAAGTAGGAGECTNALNEIATALRPQETAVVEEIGPLRKTCLLHGTNSKGREPLKLCRGSVTQQSKLAKTPQIVRNAQLLRDGIDEMIDSDLLEMPAPPTEEGRVDTSDLLDQCYGWMHELSEQDAADRAAIEYCFPSCGKLDGPEKLYHYCGDRCGPDGSASCKEVVDKFGTPALRRRKQRVYNKGKWAKEQELLRDFLKLFVHNLGFRAYKSKIVP